MPRLRALEPDGTEHYVPCAPQALRACAAHADRLAAVCRQPTSEETVLRLAQVVYAAEIEAKPAAQPSAAAAAAPGEAAPEADASHATAVESLLKARAELEVRSAAAPAPPERDER
jgi:hypothetical protein